ncbi:hypothetical protein [Pigmentiphaga litoralis]|uniref:Uncharacterized protein n=1 Tax=Pigmentiphaga litoralis TaxID=516702 RepID=A0A7Y9IQP0_9BURK|nr:hypothetical protein [Pigmentiphaga litoralis]NYE25605.1 hypothetical protein [Pigmentiphaga litoralis]NYE80783.1 hypothetical protein [Pigmentiphaga litoralis]
MKVCDLVQFRSDLFFDGAVQLLWAEDQIERADEAAKSFVFHGPRYHGVKKDAQGDEIYRLTDTATLIADLLTRIADDTAAHSNPFSLAIAGYGSGKSHFALVLARMLREPHSVLSEHIVSNLTLAEPRAAESARQALGKIEKPALVITLDGTGNFNLGNALSASLFRSLKEHRIEDFALRELSPRFDDAANFVKRNYALRTSEFAARFPNRTQQSITDSLEARDEDAYALVDALYWEANGAHIPVSGRESIQDLITVFCETYCSQNGPFSRLVILFDEFGRFLEYVAERPALAGDSALQQIFQGIQDNASQAHFLGFIQYELKAYLARLGNRDAMHIQKYITRFDVAKKYYVSSNLETIIAHLLEKKNEAALEMSLTRQRPAHQALHKMMAALLPGLRQLPVWSDPDEFERVIVRGCWPLHPLATWFLTRQQDIVQSRSAITFVKNAVDATLDRAAIEGNNLTSISASRILTGEMLTEMLAAERAHGGVSVDNLMAALTKYDSQIDEIDRGLLIAITSTKKMRVISSEQDSYNRLLVEFVGRPIDACLSHLTRLEQVLGVIAWSKELKQYEIVTDAATRGQYQKDLGGKLARVGSAEVQEIFLTRAKAWSEDLFNDISTTCGYEFDVPTLEWSFTAQLTNDQRVSASVQNAFNDWRQAVKPSQPKGQILYCLTSPEADVAALQLQIEDVYSRELKKSGVTTAPVWTVVLSDRSARVHQYLATLYVLEDSFDHIEQERYARFIPEEREQATLGLRTSLRDAIKDRVSLVAGTKVVPGRLNAEASAIFKNVYPKALPFPFDGFNTLNGTGSADVAVLARALFGGEVSQAWLAVQQVKLQNRVRAVLGTSWGVLSRDAQIKSVPENLQIRAVLQHLEDAHKSDPQRTLLDNLAMLTKPPFGCSLASASLLIALFVGKSVPPRAIQYQRSGISLKDWLVAAYGTTSRYLSELALQKTTILFLTEDAITRWQLLMNTWETETTFEGNVKRWNEAVRMRSHDPLPEQLEGNFKFLCQKAEADHEQLRSYASVLEALELRLEDAFKHKKTQEYVAVAEKYLTRRKEMTAQKGKWSEQQLAKINGLCDEMATLVREVMPKWIPLQACNALEQIPDFRAKMIRVQRTLEGLGIRDQSRAVEQHTQEMIAHVQERCKYTTALDSASNLIGTPNPSASMPLREVSDQIERAQAIVSLLTEALSTLSKADDIKALIAQLQEKQEKLRDFRKERQRVYVELLNMAPATSQSALDVLHRLNLMGQQFSGTRDADGIQHRRKSCTDLVNLLAEFDKISGPADNVAHLLEVAYASSAVGVAIAPDTDDNEELDEENEWIKTCVTHYIEARDALAKQRSSVWTVAAVEELAALQGKPAQLANEGVPAKFVSLPAELSSADRARVTAKLEELDTLRVQALEHERAVASAAWVAQLHEHVASLSTLSGRGCTELLSMMDACPSYVSANDFDQVVELKTRIENRLDELDISALVDRIKEMAPEKRAQVLSRLLAFEQIVV